MVEEIKRKRDRGGDWHVLESTFSRESGLEAANVDGVPILVPGKLGDVPVVQIPASATPEMFERISKAITEAAGVEPFIITSNVQLLKFRRVDDKTAKSMMRAAREKMEAMRAGVEAKAGEAPPTETPNVEANGQQPGGVDDGEDDPEVLDEGGENDGGGVLAVDEGEVP